MCERRIFPLRSSFTNPIPDLCDGLGYDLNLLPMIAKTIEAQRGGRTATVGHRDQEKKGEGNPTL
jgi:hypothetical protein